MEIKVIFHLICDHPGRLLILSQQYGTCVSYEIGPQSTTLVLRNPVPSNIPQTPRSLCFPAPCHLFPRLASKSLPRTPVYSSPSPTFLTLSYTSTYFSDLQNYSRLPFTPSDPLRLTTFNISLLITHFVGQPEKDLSFRTLKRS